MADEVYRKFGTLGFEAFINDIGIIIVCQEDVLNDTLEAIELSAEEAEDLASCLLELAKKLRG